MTDWIKSPNLANIRSSMMDQIGRWSDRSIGAFTLQGVRRIGLAICFFDYQISSSHNILNPNPNFLIWQLTCCTASWKNLVCYLRIGRAFDFKLYASSVFFFLQSKLGIGALRVSIWLRLSASWEMVFCIGFFFVKYLCKFGICERLTYKSIKTSDKFFSQ